MCACLSDVHLQLSYAASSGTINDFGTGLGGLPGTTVEDMFVSFGEKGAVEVYEICRILGPFPSVRNKLDGTYEFKRKAAGFAGEAVSEEGLYLKYNQLTDGRDKVKLWHGHQPIRSNRSHTSLWKFICCFLLHRCSTRRSPCGFSVQFPSSQTCALPCPSAATSLLCTLLTLTRCTIALKVTTAATGFKAREVRVVVEFVSDEILVAKVGGQDLVFEREAALQKEVARLMRADLTKEGQRDEEPVSLIENIAQVATGAKSPWDAIFKR